MKTPLALVAIAVLSLGLGSHADAQTPLRVCGVVTAYFVSDIPAGGRIELDGTNYPIASSASFQRTTPLPAVTVGSRVCVEGTRSSDGRLLDFTVTPVAVPSASTPGQLPSTGTRSASGTAESPAALGVGLAIETLILVGWAGRKRLGVR